MQNYSVPDDSQKIFRAGFDAAVADDASGQTLNFNAVGFVTFLVKTMKFSAIYSLFSHK